MEFEDTNPAKQLDEKTWAMVNRMRLMRNLHGWGAGELSDQMRMKGCYFPRSIIANLENKRRAHVTMQELLTLAEVLGVKLQWLATGEGPACSFCLDDAPEGYICKQCRKEGGVTWNLTDEA